MPEVVFVHPDLGIGGAERLIVDAALALKQKGHSVRILTAHHDHTHCFPETTDGSIPVQVYGDWLPRNIFGYMTALCAYIRMVYLAMCLILNTSLAPDVLILDQISIPIPLLKLKTGKIMFYCHFPDQLLSSSGGRLKQLYRAPLNWLEDRTTNQAAKIFVNSKFTAQVFMKTFHSAEKEPAVLYPSLPTANFDATRPISLQQLDPIHTFNHDDIVFLSLNRYERKKNIALAIKAFAEMKNNLLEEEWAKCRLVVAGGYDNLLAENVEHIEELQALIAQYNLIDQVKLFKSPSEPIKISLITHSRCLLYTPSHEHFGIVPLEAMYLRTPVIAVNSGGPTETVADGITGYLLPPEPKAWATKMAAMAKDAEMSKKMGESGRKRVQEEFSFEQFSNVLDKAVRDLVAFR